MTHTLRSSRSLCVLSRTVLFALLMMLSVVSATAAGVPHAGSADTPSTIDSCVTIDEPGTYALTRSIENADAETCLRITVSDVRLDGRGHSVDGADRDPGSIGILVKGRETVRNVTVRNVTVVSWETGVAYGNKSGSNTLRNNTVRNSTAGIRIEGSSDNTVRNNTVRDNVDGIRLVGSSDNTFRNNTIRDNTGWSVIASPSADGTGSAHNTFESPDFGFSNASISFTIGDAAMRTVPEDDRPTPPANKEDIGVYLNATSLSDGGYVDLDILYDEETTTGIDESTLSVWRYDGTWSNRSGTLDTGSNTLVKNITSFSVFAPLAANRTVQKESNFSVSVAGTNSPVTEGDRMEVTATVENTGDEAATQEVTLTVGGEVHDRTDVRLAGGETKTVELTWETGSGDAGNYTASISTANDTAKRDVVVEESTSFVVRDLELPSNVTAGEQFTVSAVVENTGEYAGETEVDLVSIKGEPFDYSSETVSLSPGESTTVDVVFETQRGDGGTYTIGLVAGNGSYDDVNETPGDSSATGTVVVNAPPTVRALEFFPCDPDCDGDPVTVSLADSGFNDVEMSRGAMQNRTMIIPNTSDDGSIESYEWRINGEPVGRSGTLEYSGWEPGQYEVALTVTDVEGASTTVRVNVTVEGANEPPTVSIGGLHNVTARDETTLTAEATDPDGNITTYVWRVDGEVVSRSQTLAYTFEEAGEHEVTLTVTDGQGASVTARRTVTVNAPPTVSVEVDPSSPTVGEPVNVTVEASDPDGSVADYRLDMDGDGEYETGSSETEQRYAKAGVYEIKVQVTDEDGATATATRNVDVSGPSTPTEPGTATTTISVEGPGFGFAVGILALAGVALLARRR